MLAQCFHLPIYLNDKLSIYLFVCVPSLPIFLTVNLSVCVSVCLSVCLCVCLSFCLSYESDCHSLFLPLVCLSYTSVCLSFGLSFYSSHCQSLFLHASLGIDVCLSASPSIWLSVNLFLEHMRASKHQTRAKNTRQCNRYAVISRLEAQMAFPLVRPS